LSTSNKYIVVGGNPYQSYTGTISYTGINILGSAKTAKEVKDIMNKHYDDCSGLILTIDLETGREFDWGRNEN